MALTLVIYPATDYNSFVTLAEADAIIESDVNYPTWAAETDDEVKKRYLITAFRNIVALNGLTLPATAEDCLKESQSLMAVHDIVNGISTASGTPGQIESAKVGPVEVKYTDGSPASDIGVFPAVVYKCLESYGAYFTGSSFRFDRA